MPLAVASPKSSRSASANCGLTVIMDLNYGYLFSTDKVAEDFAKYDTFMQDKETFESTPNVNLSRSIDSDGNPIIPPEVCSPGVLSSLYS